MRACVRRRFAKLLTRLESLRTIEWHRANIIEKLKLKGAAHLGVAAHEYARYLEYAGKNKKGKN